MERRSSVWSGAGGEETDDTLLHADRQEEQVRLQDHNVTRAAVDRRVVLRRHSNTLDFLTRCKHALMSPKVVFGGSGPWEPHLECRFAPLKSALRCRP